MSAKTAIAIGAHPDDIEFYMGGTLLLLKQAGYAIHYMNVANGNCGSVDYNYKQAIAVRRKEGQAADHIIGATYNESPFTDVEMTYDLKLLRRLGAVVRDVKPAI